MKLFMDFYESSQTFYYSTLMRFCQGARENLHIRIRNIRISDHSHVDILKDLDQIMRILSYLMRSRRDISHSHKISTRYSLRHFETSHILMLTSHRDCSILPISSFPAFSCHLIFSVKSKSIASLSNQKFSKTSIHTRSIGRRLQTSKEQRR